MAMVKREKQQKQQGLWVAAANLPKSASHPFYQRLNEFLDEQRFDEFCERKCARFYAAKMGRPGLMPGMYFRLLMLGYFEGIDSERDIAWRAADSLSVRGFLRLMIGEEAPDRSTISRTRRLMDQETHREVFGWVLGRLADFGLSQKSSNFVTGIKCARPRARHPTFSARQRPVLALSLPRESGAV